MDRKDFRILLYRFHPYVTAGAEISPNPKQEMFCTKGLSLYPPLGLGHVAGALKGAGYEHVKIVDAWAEKLDEAAFGRKVEEFAPNLVGCTIWTTNMNSELAMLGRIKQRFPDVTAVVGGPHLDVYPRECLENTDFVDFGVVGEGEKTAVKLFETVRTGGNSFTEIKGIVYRDGQEVIYTGPRPPVKELDSLPYPDFSGLPVQNYFSGAEKISPLIYVFSARACPYRCKYCFNSRDRGYRQHSVDYIIDYIKFLKREYDVKEVTFMDETFTFDRKRTLLFCERYKAEGIGLPYTIRTRADHVDEEIIIALKESGCYRLHFGVESGVQEVLDRMRRKMTLQQIRDAIALTKKHGILVSANFMIGYLEESMDTYERTVEFIKELDPDHVNIFITTVLPATDLYFEALERGILKTDVWRDFAQGRIPCVDMRGLRLPGKDYGVDDLENMLARAYRRIYFRPRFILKKLRRVRSPEQISRYLKQGTAMLSNRFLRSLKKAEKIL
jgi:anaerobic magnesium-protoporphyrin IX monomethyl ester cyclase